MKQQQLELTIETEIQGFKKDIHKEQVMVMARSRGLTAHTDMRAT